MQGVNLIIAFQLKTDLLPPKSRLTPYLKSEQVDFLTGKLLWHKNAPRRNVGSFILEILKRFSKNQHFLHFIII